MMILYRTTPKGLLLLTMDSSAFISKAFHLVFSPSQNNQQLSFILQVIDRKRNVVAFAGDTTSLACRIICGS